MVNFKLVVGSKDGKSTSYEVKDEQAKPLIGLRIGDVFDATVIGLPGRIRITGGSDKAGVPMRPDVHGAVKKYVLLTKGIGLRRARKGERIRKLVRGNMISDEIYQINAVLVEGDSDKGKGGEKKKEEEGGRR
ncbi:MAG: 30S ribosomal protein S6e [Candidatus Nitrosocaldus sp.]|nr:30S ribosomal protein S6e [Candidatus Nitrosocaldus sp.]MCS7141197.1 30S ribosomal protein S6e [Candidatus Nitrosocaldus sp.]MDW8000197.1 30S ribosomal protein S6e [Candidatus Nitrosocaldus sp.]